MKLKITLDDVESEGKPRGVGRWLIEECVRVKVGKFYSLQLIVSRWTKKIFRPLRHLITVQNV